MSSRLSEFVHIQLLRELEVVVDLFTTESVVIEIESLRIEQKTTAYIQLNDKVVGQCLVLHVHHQLNLLLTVVTLVIYSHETTISIHTVNVSDSLNFLQSIQQVLRILDRDGNSIIVHF